MHGLNSEVGFHDLKESTRVLIAGPNFFMFLCFSFPFSSELFVLLSSAVILEVALKSSVLLFSCGVSSYINFRV